MLTIITGSFPLSDLKGIQSKDSFEKSSQILLSIVSHCSFMLSVYFIPSYILVYITLTAPENIYDIKMFGTNEYVNCLLECFLKLYNLSHSNFRSTLHKAGLTLILLTTFWDMGEV